MEICWLPLFDSAANNIKYLAVFVVKQLLAAPAGTCITYFYFALTLLLAVSTKLLPLLLYDALSKNRFGMENLMNRKITLFELEIEWSYCGSMENVINVH